MLPHGALALLWLCAGCGGGGDRATASTAAADVRFAACVPADAYWPTAGWRPTCPPAAGVDSSALRAAFDEAPRALQNLLSLVVVRHGYVVGENYYGGARAGTTFEMRSVTKSVTSALVGAAMQQGLVDSTGHRLYDLLPGYFVAGDDPRKRDITLRHMLSMEAGWSPNSAVPSVAPYVAALIGRPLSAAPGIQWEYDDGTYHTLAGAVDRAVGKDLYGFATRRLFAPLGMSVPPRSWATDDQGIPFGSGGLLLTARDMAKLGYLYLHDGAWDGQRLLAAGWVDSTFVARAVGAGDSPVSYGYGWWGFAEGGHTFHYALGFGGQFVAIAPDLDLVVVVTANPYAAGADAPVERFRALLRDHLLPAVLPE